MGKCRSRCPKRDIVELISRETRFGAFLRANRKRIPAVVLSKHADVSRQHIHRLRYRLAEPTLAVMVRLRTACSRCLRRHVRMVELFDLGDGE